MKKIELYEILIKIIGIYFLLSTIGILKEVLSACIMLFSKNSSVYEESSSIYNMIILIGGFNFLFQLTASSLIIWKAKNIANKIARNSDSEENVSINLDKQIILQIAITIAAFLMFFWTIPDFFLNLKNYLGLIINEMPTKEFDTSIIILSAFKIVISVFSVTYSQKLSSFLSKKQV